MEDNKKLWRTLVRIENIYETINGTLLFLIIPAWDVKLTVIRKRELFPAEMPINIGQRFHCMVNIGAKFSRSLKFVGPFEYE